LAEKTVESDINWAHTRFLISGIRFRIGVYNIITIFAIWTTQRMFGGINTRFNISDREKILIDVAVASRFVIWPVIRGRDGLLILSSSISKISLIIMLFDIIRRIIEVLTKKLLLMIAAGLTINVPVALSRTVGIILAGRISL
jgi:hypothetical protein